MVRADEYVRRMAELFGSEYQLATSNALQAAWRLMAQTFNVQIAGQNPKPWQVLPLPTGTGKTIGLAVFCSMLSREPHPGVLIACRMRDQADELAETINRFAEKPVALAHHTNSRMSFEDCRSIPVLIVTHEAYRRVMDAYAQGEIIRSNWHQFMEWKHGTRKLTVIDEGLDIFEHTKVELRDVSYTAATLLRAFRDKAENAHALLRRLSDSLEHLTAASGSFAPDALLWPKGSEAEHIVNDAIDPLLGMISKAPTWRFAAAAGDGEIVDADKLRCRLVLTELRKLLKLSPRPNRIGVRTTLNAARSVLPEVLRDAVILDATAKVNPVYRLMTGSLDIIEIPAEVRCYGNVLVHISTGHKVGKRHLEKEGETALAQLIPELEEVVKLRGRLLLLLHKQNECKALKFKTRFDKFDAAHWGALDGRNDWSDYDSVAVFGLPYLDDASVECMLVALGKVPDRSAVAAFKRGVISTRVLQGVNRARCRRMIDSAGNCASTQVCLMLPAGETADGLLHDLRTEMPGIVEVDWQPDVARKRRRVSSYEEPLVRHLKQAAHGPIRAAQVRQELSIPARSFDSLTAKVRDPSSALAVRLAGLGVRYIGGGGRAGALFVVCADDGDRCSTA